MSYKTAIGGLAGGLGRGLRDLSLILERRNSMLEERQKEAQENAEQELEKRKQMRVLKDQINSVFGEKQKQLEGEHFLMKAGFDLAPKSMTRGGTVSSPEFLEPEIDESGMEERLLPGRGDTPGDFAVTMQQSGLPAAIQTDMWKSRESEEEKPPLTYDQMHDNIVNAPTEKAALETLKKYNKDFGTDFSESLAERKPTTGSEKSPKEKEALRQEKILKIAKEQTANKIREIERIINSEEKSLAQEMADYENTQQGIPIDFMKNAPHTLQPQLDSLKQNLGIVYDMLKRNAAGELINPQEMNEKIHGKKPPKPNQKKKSKDISKMSNEELFKELTGQ